MKITIFLHPLCYWKKMVWMKISIFYHQKRCRCFNFWIYILYKIPQLCADTPPEVIHGCNIKIDWLIICKKGHYIQASRFKWSRVADLLKEGYTVHCVMANWKESEGHVDESADGTANWWCLLEKVTKIVIIDFL